VLAGRALVIARSRAVVRGDGGERGWVSGAPAPSSGAGGRGTCRCRPAARPGRGG
jgi:hypothetical protein